MAQRQLPTRFRSLSSKLLWLTILFVMIAEVLIFVPSVANFGKVWLQQRLDTVAAASVIITAEESFELPETVQDDVLMATGVEAIALRRGTQSQLLIVSDMPLSVDAHVAIDQMNPLTAIVSAFDTLFFGGDRMLRVSGTIGNSDEPIEIFIADRDLRNAMLIYGRNVLVISLIISFITAALVFMAINRIMIMPIRRMSGSMIAFGDNPEDPTSVIEPSTRRDELGVAEQQLSDMQNQLQRTLRNQKKLADLGLAVSKINHDMRNILASAQLMSDRLSETADPSIQRFAPKLMRAISRAVSYSSDVLAYGKPEETAPQRRRIKPADLARDVGELLAGDMGDLIDFEIKAHAALEIDADPDQLFRVLMNLSRNAVQAMKGHPMPDTVHRLTISAYAEGGDAVLIVEDTGPGIPEKARANLFDAFRGSQSRGGSGLGLAIADELVRAHGGRISLREDRLVGTHFDIILPGAVAGQTPKNSGDNSSSADSGHIRLVK
ncbi:MAG: HAMP domain-containing sensor histidine kinase [Pseudomonadota bacterium]